MKDVPSRTTQSGLLMSKDKLGQIPALKFQKTRALNISSVASSAVPDLLRGLAILSDVTVRRLTVEWEDLIPYQKSKKTRRLTTLLLTGLPMTLLTTKN